MREGVSGGGTRKISFQSTHSPRWSECGSPLGQKTANAVGWTRMQKAFFQNGCIKGAFYQRGGSKGCLLVAKRVKVVAT